MSLSKLYIIYKLRLGVKVVLNLLVRLVEVAVDGFMESFGSVGPYICFRPGSLDFLFSSRLS